MLSKSLNFKDTLLAPCQKVIRSSYLGDVSPQMDQLFSGGDLMTDLVASSINVILGHPTSDLTSGLELFPDPSKLFFEWNDHLAARVAPVLSIELSA